MRNAYTVKIFQHLEAMDTATIASGIVIEQCPIDGPEGIIPCFVGGPASDIDVWMNKHQLRSVQMGYRLHNSKPVNMGGFDYEIR